MNPIHIPEGATPADLTADEYLNQIEQAGYIHAAQVIRGTLHGLRGRCEELDRARKAMGLPDEDRDSMLTQEITRHRKWLDELRHAENGELKCCECGEWFHTDDLVWHPASDDYLCRDCIGDEEFDQRKALEDKR